MVAVAYREQQRCKPLHAVACAHLLLSHQRLKCLLNGKRSVRGDAEAADLTAAQHQTEGICGGLLAKAVRQRHDGMVGVVDQQHNVRQLKTCAAAHLHARRDSLQHRALGGTDTRLRALMIVVFLQIDQTQKSLADGQIGLVSAHVDHAVPVLLEHLNQIFVHCGINAGNALLLLVQIHLGQYHIERGGGITHLALGCFPVFGLTGELVAGHHGPLICVILVKIGQ